MKSSKQPVPSARRDRGSALLVSLMVMVGLSLLGLGFVAISETESAISLNERNYTQTLQVAEAGAKVVVEWFQKPEWAFANGLMPANTAAIKQERKAIHDGDPYEGYYKPIGLLFDLPHKPAPENRFFGVDADSADIVIDETTAAAFLDTFNTRLFGANFEGGRVTQIRLYAPPILNPTTGNETTTHNGNEFWNEGDRFGVATVEVTAEKHRVPTDETSPVVSRRRVRLVISEFPFPGPEGPLQSQEGIGTNGNFQVHWGKVVSYGTLDLKVETLSLPWLDAWTPSKYECGYNSPNYVSCAGNPNYFGELLKKSFPDPWFHARARGQITSDEGLTDPQAYPYSSVNNSETAAGVAGNSNQFQDQFEDDFPLRREVLFPTINYKFWKQIAISGQGQQGMHYLRWVPGTTDTFVDSRGTQKTFRGWVNLREGGEEGFFFFDTKTGADPQQPNGQTTDVGLLTPAIDLQGGDFFMKGFIYLNTVSFGTQGIGEGAGPNYYVNAPGEPFRDVGFQEVDKTTMTLVVEAGKPKIVNDTNYRWDYRELNDNDHFDLKLQKVASYARDGTDNAGPLIDVWIPVPFFNGCTTFGQAGQCSEPHEPYLNLIYPSPSATLPSGAPASFMVGWEDPGTQTRRPILRQTNSTLPIACSPASTEKECTSNTYDEDGGLMIIADKGPMLDGVFYNQGNYSSTGNAVYYGSVVVRGPADKAGTVDIWFDESLVKGDWQKRFDEMPRVLVTAHETDM